MIKHRNLHAQIQMMKNRGYITVQEAADIAGIGLSTMYAWLDADLVVNKRIGRARYVSEASLRSYLKPT